MSKRPRYLLVAALFGVAGVVWWQGGIVALLPDDLQYMHVLVLDRQLKQARENPSALDKLWLDLRTRRVASAYQTFLQRHPQHVPAHVAYGCFLAEEDRHDESARQWQQAIALDPHAAVAHNNLGEYYLHRGQIGQALGCLDQAIAADPQGAVYYYNWATACSSYRQDSHAKYGWDTDEIMQRSLAAFRTARDLAPQDFVYSNAYAEMFYFTPQANWDEAYEAWRFCLNQPLDELDRERTCGRIARVCMHLGRFDEASAWLAKMQSPGSRAFRTALERKHLALVSGAVDDAGALQMMRAVSDASGTHP